MAKRMVIMLVIVGLLLGAIVGFNLFKAHMIQKFMANSPIPPATVTAMKAEYQQWQPQLGAVGSLRAVRGVEVSSEIAGLVRSLHFKSGGEVQGGELLVELNADADLAQLRALEAAAELARATYERAQAQFELRAVSRAALEAAEADFKSKAAQVGQQTALVGKKTIRAPFSGRVGISTVNPGQYLNPGDKIVTLQALNPIYIDFYLPQQQFGRIAVGQKLLATVDGYPGQTFSGKISAVSPKVDAATRNVQVQASLPNPKGLLLPGMYANVRIESGGAQRYLTLPQTAISYSPYGNTVFTVKASETKDDKGNPQLTAQQAFVTTGATRGDQVAILSGLEPDTLVVTSGGIKLKNGTPLIINNSVQPANDANPRPQEQ